MKRLGIALALATLAGMLLAPVAHADRDDRRGHLARKGGPDVERHAGHHYGRGGDRRYRGQHRRHRGHRAARHRWHAPRQRWHAPPRYHAPRYRHHRGHRHRHGRGYTSGYGVGVSFTIDGVTFGLGEIGLR
ncbi:MAG: hypothetical protein U5K43_07655 [Halofilum sp. (in: g-proteobacteria)]|nr:hypothetical protein [Halofilum sp. (in: g-proteobacteria)]